MTDILDKQSRDTVTQKLLEYVKNINLPSSMIKDYMQFILENSTVYIEKVDEFLKQNHYVLYEGYVEYTPFGYKYLNEHKQEIYVNPDPLNEYINNQNLERNLFWINLKK